MIIVTGASRGLGRAICERLIAKGETILGIARNIENIPFSSLRCDVSSYDEVKSVIKQLKRDRAEISGLINAAGIASMNLTVTTPPKTLYNLIHVNLLGTIYFCQQVAPLMIKKKNGSIVNFSTIAVALGLKGEAIYTASKAGVEGFSRSFAREMADFNIRVNCIAPGPIQTDLLKGVTANQIEKIIKQQIIPKQFKADDICDIVEILLDMRSASLSGQVLHIGGV